MAFEAKVIKHSASTAGAEIITMQLKYPRFIHAEFMTHREFSRNASSSRAIPVAKMIEQVRNDPAMPIHWGANQSGMQAENEISGKDRYGNEIKELIPLRWQEAAKMMASFAQEFSDHGLHKQVANRILEPFQWMHVIMTTTCLSNFFGLRMHKDAQPEIKHLAELMHAAVEDSVAGILLPDEWHLPYIDVHDRVAAFEHLKQNRIIRSEPSDSEVINVLVAMSAARCARVSYLTHDGQKPTVQQDLDLYHRLAGAQPLHASPLEHQATPDWREIVVISQLDGEQGEHVEEWANASEHGNLKGWRQFRKMVPGEYINA